MFDAPATLMTPSSLASEPVHNDRPRTPYRSGGGFERLISGPGGLVTGSCSGGLAGLILKKCAPRRLKSHALNLGGIAVISGLAFSAWQKWNAPNTAYDGENGPITVEGHSPSADAVPSQPAYTPRLLGTNFLPTAEASQQALAYTLVKAIISAAKAGGTLSTAEQSSTASGLEALRLPQIHKDFLLEELAKPANMQPLIDAATSPEVAATIYMASIMVIRRTTMAERDYLGLLAARLRLAPDLVAHLHASADAATVK